MTHRSGPWSLGIAVLLLCASCSDSGTRPAPEVIAHRGLTREAPENTLPAFEAALAQGLSIEMDLRLTRDGHVVVIHDEDLSATTNGEGRVAETTLDQIRELDAGSGFDARFAGTRVPTLDEVLALVRERSRAEILVGLHLKAPGHGIEAKIAKSVHEHGLLEEVFVFGQDPASSEKLKAAEPRLRTTAVVRTEADYELALENALADTLWMTYLPGRQEVARSHAQGKPIWLSLEITEKRPRIWGRARSVGIDGIVTDWPLLCAQHFRE